MFDNISETLKGFAKFIFWAGIIGFIILAFITFGKAQDAYRDEKALFITQGLLYLIVGTLGTLLTSCILFGFGELIERVINIDYRMKHIDSTINNTFCERKQEKTVTAKQSASGRDELLDNLLQNGMISEDEYDQMKEKK